MPRVLNNSHYDVIVLGAGASGVIAATAAAALGARTALIERGTAPGGELLSGMAILGSSNSRGELLIGGPAMDLMNRLSRLGGVVGRPFDGRTMWGFCINPELMKLAVPEALADAGVDTYLGATATDVVTQDGSVTGLIVEGRGTPLVLNGSMFVDASGDAFVSQLAGADFEYGSDQGQLQPMSLMFRAAPVDYSTLLTFIRDHPDEFMLGESDVTSSKTTTELAADIYTGGLPFACLQAEGGDTLLRAAMDQGDMYPTTGIYMYPTSAQRQELCLNTTRISDIDPFDSRAAGDVYATLSGQITTVLNFARSKIPGFTEAEVSGVAPRVGVRETRRIVGVDRLETDDVIHGRKLADVVAKGGHHVDVHGADKDQKRIHVTDGRSYDIPFGALVPQNLANVMVSGRCFSSSREANGSARHMGSCMAMGQAAGTATALAVRDGLHDVREMAVGHLQDVLRAEGAVLDGIA